MARPSNLALARVGLFALATLLTLAAGASRLLLASPYAPLAVAGVFVAALAMVFWSRRPALALYSAVFVVTLPLGLIPAGIHSQLNRAMTVLVLAVWLFDTITRRRRITITSTAVWMLAFWAWACLTLLWAGNLDRASNALQTYALRFLLFLLVLPNVIRRRDDLRGLINTLALHGWVVILAALFTVLQEGYAPGTRLKVFGENENGLGILLLVGLPGVLSWPHWHRPRWRGLGQAAALAYVVCTIALVAMSGSRGSAISLVAMLALFMLWKPTRLSGIAGLGILLVALLGASTLFTTLVERLLVEQGDTMLGGREALWQAAWLVIRQYPWRGTGIGTAPYAIRGYVEQMRSVWGADITPIHNPLLTIWTETGIPGLILYLGVLGSAVTQLIGSWLRLRERGDHDLRFYCAVVAGVMAGYLLSWFKGGGMESDLTYFLMLALLIAPSSLAHWSAPEAVSPQGQEPDLAASAGTVLARTRNEP